MWHAKTKDEALSRFAVDPAVGLSAEEARNRLNRHGPNQLKGKPKKSVWTLFAEQLRDMLIYVLLGAAVITFAVGEYTDAAIILAVVLLNAAIGVIQENKAEKAIEALQQMAAPRALVRRDGVVREVDAAEVVPGDIVILDAGRYVPADLRLIDSVNLQVEESALTGESVPVDKDAGALPADVQTPLGDRRNMAFMSTLVTYGRGEGVVVATAMDTEMGKIAKILDEDARQLTPLQKKLEELGKMLGFVAIGICALIFVIGLLQQRNLYDMFLTAISLAVAAIPEGLPAIVAIVLALGVTKMAKINAIVRKLPAVETLGSVSVICSDKTGTLTQNKMTVVDYYTLNEPKSGASGDSNMEPVGDPIRESAGDSSREPVGDPNRESAGDSSRQLVGDPTAIALVEFAHRHHVRKRELDAQYPRVSERPFDSERKRMSTLNRTGAGYRVYVKGAIDPLLELSSSAWVDGKIVPMTEERKRRYSAAAAAMSDRALRVLAAAYKETDRVIAPEDMERDLTFLGFVGMMDPPREEAKASIREAKSAGITPKSGDERLGRRDRLGTDSFGRQ